MWEITQPIAAKDVSAVEAAPRADPLSAEPLSAEPFAATVAKTTPMQISIKVVCDRVPAMSSVSELLTR